MKYARTHIISSIFHYADFYRWIVRHELYQQPELANGAWLSEVSLTHHVAVASGMILFSQAKETGCDARPQPPTEDRKDGTFERRSTRDNIEILNLGRE